jgi:hypothetical protein
MNRIFPLPGWQGKRFIRCAEESLLAAIATRFVRPWIVHRLAVLFSLKAMERVRFLPETGHILSIILLIL